MRNNLATTDTRILIGMILVGVFVVFFLKVALNASTTVLSPSEKSFDALDIQIKALLSNPDKFVYEEFFPIDIESNFKIIGYDLDYSSPIKIGQLYSEKLKEKPDDCFGKACLCLFYKDDLVNCHFYDGDIVFTGFPYMTGLMINLERDEKWNEIATKDFSKNEEILEMRKVYEGISELNSQDDIDKIKELDENGFLEFCEITYKELLLSYLGFGVNHGLPVANFGYYREDVTEFLKKEGKSPIYYYWHGYLYLSDKIPLIGSWDSRPIYIEKLNISNKVIITVIPHDTGEKEVKYALDNQLVKEKLNVGTTIVNQRLKLFNVEKTDYRQELFQKIKNLEKSLEIDPNNKQNYLDIYDVCQELIKVDPNKFLPSHCTNYASECATKTSILTDCTVEKTPCICTSKTTDVCLDGESYCYKTGCSKEIKSDSCGW